MEKIRLGTSPLLVSNIGLGAMNFGTKVSQEKSFDILNRYLDLGGNFIDTSNNYAVWNGGDGGESERVLGAWQNQCRNRSKIVLATKVGALPKIPGSKGFSNMQGLKRDVILKSVDQSMQNLQTDYLDLLYLHVDDYETPQYEVMKTLAELVEQGTVKAIGCSNFYTYRIESARQIARENQFPFFSAVQLRYSFLVPIMDADFTPQIPAGPEHIHYLEHHRDMSLVAYSPLLKGQYNQAEIQQREYQTGDNQWRLNYVRENYSNPNRYVIEYINKTLGGSIALVSTSNVKHLEELLIQL